MASASRRRNIGRCRQIPPTASPRRCASGWNGSPATSTSAPTTSPGRRSAAATPTARTRRCRPTCSGATSKRLRARADRLSFTQRSLTDLLRDSPAASFDAYVLLDAQDWMNDAELTDAVDADHPHCAPRRAGDLPHRRRRAAAARPHPGRSARRLGTTRPSAAASSAQRDRSSIYGAFHLYTLAGNGR